MVVSKTVGRRAQCARVRWRHTVHGRRSYGSTQCDKNCSFGVGDVSLAASFLRVWPLIAERNVYRWWIELAPSRPSSPLCGWTRLAFSQRRHVCRDNHAHDHAVLARLILEERLAELGRAGAMCREPDIIVNHFSTYRHTAALPEPTNDGFAMTGD